jgi:hypothetical protein
VRAVFWILSLLFLASCFNEGDCLITSTNLVKVDLFERTNGTSQPLKFIRVHQLEDDLELLASDTTVSTFQLPLSPDRLESSFEFMTFDSVTYLLSLRYTKFTRVIAADCGAFQYYQDLKVDSTTFDHVKVTSPQLFTSVKSNLQVYF